MRKLVTALLFVILSLGLSAQQYKSLDQSDKKLSDLEQNLIKSDLIPLDKTSPKALLYAPEGIMKLDNTLELSVISNKFKSTKSTEVNYDFTATSGTNTLYFRILEGTNVALVPQFNDMDSNYTVKPTGVLTIPGSVVNSETTYTLTLIDSLAFISCDALSGTVNIPSSVTKIAYASFAFSGIDSLTLNEGLETIGSQAFFECSKLAGGLTIPNSVKTIGFGAFQSCAALTSLVIGSGVEIIDAQAFVSCAGLVGSLVIPNSVKSIGKSAFQGCGRLKSLSLGANLEIIGDQAFYLCDSLTGELIIPNSVISIGAVAFLMNKGFTSLTLGTGLKTIGQEAFAGAAFKGGLIIPNSVIDIGAGAFTYIGGFTGSLAIPNSVKTIGASAFEACIGFDGGLTLGTGLTSLGSKAFMNCYLFTGDLIIPNSLDVVDVAAFLNCFSFESLVIGNSVKFIGNQAFRLCYGLTGTLIIPNSVEIIDWSAFENCRKLTGLTLGSNLQTIGAQSFYLDSSIRGDLIIPNSVKSIGVVAFTYSGFDGDLIIGDGVKDIGVQAFTNCRFKGNLTIGDAVTNIDTMAFYASPYFEGRLTIGKKVETIRRGAFASCLNISDIQVSAQVPPTLETLVFMEVPLSTPITVPCNKTATYKAVPAWNVFTAYTADKNTFTSVESSNEDYGSVNILIPASCAHDSIKFEAIPALNYQFAKWSDGVTDNPRVAKVNRDTVFTAEFTFPYRVVFHNNGGTGEMDTMNFNYGMEQDLSPNTFTKTGYTFKGWDILVDASTIIYTNEEEVNNLTTELDGLFNLYAVWEANTYSVKFLSNNGTNKDTLQNFTYDVSANLIATGFVKAEYIFVGWDTASTATNALYNAEDEVKNISAKDKDTVMFYAVWVGEAAETFTITFNKNEGEGTMANQEFTEGITQKLTKNIYTRTNYAFEGWATTPTGTVTYADEASYIATENATLYAKWKPTYIVTFNKNGGIGTMATQEFVSGETQALNTNTYTRTNYTFMGWATTASGTVTYANGADYTTTVNATLYAKWEIITYIVTFDKNGGAGTMETQEFNSGEAQNLDANAYTRVNYTFEGWATSTGGTVTLANEAEYTATTNTTLYAKWKMITYTVTFDRNGGIGMTRTQEFNKGEAKELTKNTYTRTDYTFEGWAITASGAVAYDNEESYLATADTTLYAVWKSDVSISQFQEANIVLYPNPATDYLYIKGCSPSTEGFVISNTIGKIVLNQAYTGAETTSIAISNLKAGVYIIQIYSKEGLIGTAKFIKK